MPRSYRNISVYEKEISTLLKILLMCDKEAIEV